MACHDDVHPEFTVIECAYRRAYGPLLYDYFVKHNGTWVPVGAEDYGEGTWKDVTEGYESVRVVSRPVG
jgi:hypothetical protein